MDKTTRKEIVTTVVAGFIVTALLNALMYLGATYPNSIFGLTGYLIMALLWFPLVVLYFDRPAPIMAVSAVGLFDVLVISFLIFLSRLWFRNRT